MRKARVDEVKRERERERGDVTNSRVETIKLTGSEEKTAVTVHLLIEKVLRY